MSNPKIPLRELAESTLRDMKALGIDKAQVVVREQTMREFDLQSAGIQLFRTTFDHHVSLKAIRGGRQAKAMGNQLSAEGIKKAVQSLPESIEASSQDEAYDIADVPMKKEWTQLPKNLDLEKMLIRATDFIKWSKANRPKVVYESSQFKYVENREVFLNSNGVQFESHTGAFKSTLFFTAKDGKKASSFDYVSFVEDELGGAIQEQAGFTELSEQSVQHLEPQNIPSEKFTGDLILSPYFMSEFLGSILGQLQTGTLLSGQSLFKDSLEKKIFSDQISIVSDPRWSGFASGEHRTSDGFLTEKLSIIDKGVLKSFLLDQYGSKKLGLKRATTDGDFIRIEAGQTPRQDLIKNVKKGILLTRLSAGRPSNNGDFSGVAKNSFYIENGKIVCPVKEVMVSGNYASMLKEVKGVSKETLNFGHSAYPWIHCGGATIA